MQDKAIRKTLSNPAVQLPYGFNNKVMRKIHLEVERKNKRSYIAGTIMATITSVILSGVALHLLQSYFNLNPIKTLLQSTSSQFTNPSIPYLASFFLIILLLLILDLLIRQVLNRKALK